MKRTLRQHDLEAYLDEALPAEEMAEIEKRLRRDPALLEQLSAINARRDSGVHTLSEIWRRRRASCPDRREWAAYLLGTLDEAARRYMEIHLHAVGCRFCQANLRDLQARNEEADPAGESRRRRYYESSVGRLRPRR